MEASKLFVPGTAVTWEERVKQLEEVERQLQQRLQEYEKPAGGPKIRTAFHWVIEAPKTVSWEKYTEALNASAARWRKRLADVEADLAQSTRDVAELNGRLIERQESFLAQVVRIEETWREKLREVGEEKNTKLLAVAEKCFITGYETAMGEEANYDAALKRWIESLVKMDLETECQLAPAGWQCTREVGHEGPCAAVESGVKP